MPKGFYPNNNNHGHIRRVNGKKIYSPTYVSWFHMKSRCRNKNRWDYKHYGGRGIDYCNEWEDFRVFLSEMGEKPTPKHTLERINNDGPYCKENCKWVTRYHQSRNQRSNIVVDGMILTDFAKKHGLNAHTVLYRYHRGWTVEQMKLPPDCGRAIKKGNV